MSRLERTVCRMKKRTLSVNPTMFFATLATNPGCPIQAFLA